MPAAARKPRRKAPPKEYAVPIDSFAPLPLLVNKAKKTEIKLTLESQVVAVMIERMRYNEIVTRYRELEEKLKAIERRNNDEPVEGLDALKLGGL